MFEGISKSFGSVQVVKNLNLSLNQGEIFSLLGPSGCGKTTLLRICAGFENPDSGRIILNGKDITGMPPYRRPVNTVFQNYALFPHLTVRNNIAFGLKIKRKSKRETEKEVDWALDLIQMKEYENSLPSEISGGQKQRVAIARAVVNKPQLLLLDEPLSALDLKLRQKMLLELDNIHDEVGITFLFVTHDQGESMSLSDRMAVMNLGRIEQVGTPAEIYESPVSSFTAAFIGDTNFFEGNIKSQTKDNEYSVLEIEGLPDIVCYNDQKRSTGEHIYLSVRPEKIFVASKKPSSRERQNILEGVIEDRVYMGAYTKYWVRCGTWLVVVMQPHRHFLFDQSPPPVWDDKVWLYWHGDDGFMLQRYREKDEVLLTNPDEEFSDLEPDRQPGMIVKELEGEL